jgi:hypothetical protein
LFRSSYLVAIAVVLTGRALCQIPESIDSRDCDRAAERLNSESLQEKAWGAHFGAACLIPSFAAEIASRLIRLDPEGLGRVTFDSESFWTAHAMLDALIELHQPLDASVLALIAEGFPAEAILIALQVPSTRGPFLTKFRLNHSDAEWVAASNALAKLRAPGFAGSLLREVHLANSVWVSDTGESPPHLTFTSVLSSVPHVAVPTGFPAVTLYRLTAQPAADYTLVSDGTTPIYADRTVVEPGANRILRQGGEGYCAECLRIGYLADLARLPSNEVDHIVRPLTPVRWTSPLQLRAEISQALAVQKVAIEWLVKMLRASGALEVSDLKRPFQVEILIYDQRRDRSVALPQNTSVELRLR